MLPFTSLFKEDEDEARRRRRLRNKRKQLLILFIWLDAGESGRFRDYLIMEGRWRRDRNLIRDSLVDPNSSPWKHLYESGDDGALITITGFDHQTFRLLHDGFEYYFNNYTPWCSKSGGRDGLNYRLMRSSEKRGKRRMVTSTACLGLVLAWYRFRGAEFVLQGWFCFTGTQCNVWLRFGRRMLLRFLLKQERAEVKMPTNEEIKQFQESVAERHHTLVDVYCFADGLKLPFEACSGLTKQGKYYNGWQHGHYITNLLVFGANGCIIHAVINVPGSVHDSQVAMWGGTYKLLKKVHDETGGVCCVDSAFAACKAPYLLQSSQDLTRARDAFQRVRMVQATSLRQAAEWGMRALQGAFPRLKDHIQYEENGERAVFLRLAIHLYNYRCNLVGLNQIRNVYMKHLSKDASYFIIRND
jgi:DDE superfamily endonuclease